MRGEHTDGSERGDYERCLDGGDAAGGNKHYMNGAFHAFTLCDERVLRHPLLFETTPVKTYMGKEDRTHWLTALECWRFERWTPRWLTST